MVKYLLSFLISLIIASSSFSQVAFDTVETTTVGTGMVYRKIIAPAVPWSINVLEVDLKNPNNIFESVKAKDKLYAQETVRSMAASHSYSGHTVVGAINGDFYNIGPGSPVNIQICKGEIIRGPVSRPAFGLNSDYLPMIGIVSFSGKLIDGDSSIAISDVNTSRGTDELILYNHYYYDSTGTNSFGTEVSVKAIDPWLVNDTVRCVVLRKAIGVGDMGITDSTAVLSGHGISKSFLDNNVNVGDTISIVNQVTPGLSKIKEMIGGYPQIVVDGKNTGNSDSREPRTSVGFNKDSTKFYMFTVDGRQAGLSVGMTFHELADLMISSGVYTGLNLDGGGSTTMIIRDSVMNSPSDGNERADANGFLVITSVPQNGALHSVQVSPDYFKLFKGESIQLKLQGFDNYFNPVQLDPSKISYTVDPNLGTISSGKFTVSGKLESGYIYADYEGFKDSTLIVLKSVGQIDLTPKNVVSDAYRIQQFKVKVLDTEGIQRDMALSEFKWTLSDTSVGTIDTAGNFIGKKDGTTKVIASYKNISDTAQVTVVINHGIHEVSAMDSLGGWSYSTENLDASGSGLNISGDQFTQGKGSLEVDYQLTYASSTLYWFYLNTDISVSGAPDSIYMDVKSDGQKHLMYYKITDDNGEEFQIPIKQYVTKSDAFDTLGAAISNASPISPYSNFNYPITIKQIMIKLASPKEAGQVYSGKLYLDNLRVAYPQNVTSVENSGTVPSDYSLSQNFPNPFNPTSVIRYTLPKEGIVNITVYDILGREAAVLVSGIKNSGSYNIVFNGAGLASGVYIYRLSVQPLDGSREFHSSKKMIIMK